MTLEEINVAEIQPDPAWDYYVLFSQLNQSKSKVEELIAFVKQQEEATEVSDVLIIDRLKALMDFLEEVGRPIFFKLL